MIGRHRIGALGMMTLALGVVPLPPPPKPVDMGEAERVIHELQENGLDPRSVAAHVGVEGFVELARAVLTMQRAQRAIGVEMTTPQLIAEVNALASQVSAPPRLAERREPGRQLRDERERVVEPLRILAAYTHLTTVELGEIERGVRIPTAEEWTALQVALPALGPMEAPPTEAERSPVAIDPSLAATRRRLEDQGLNYALHPCGRCICAELEATGAPSRDCEWCEMNRRRELRETRTDDRRDMLVRTARKDARQRRAKAKARKGWA